MDPGKRFGYGTTGQRAPQCFSVQLVIVAIGSRSCLESLLVGDARRRSSGEDRDPHNSL
jgi:hypothetical protein